MACSCSQLGRTKIHLCCDFNLVLQIYIVITFLYLNLTYWYCLFIMVCAITLYLSECTRPNKKSSFSGTVHKKKFHSRCCNVRDVNLTSVESFWEKFSPIWENVNDILPVLWHKTLAGWSVILFMDLWKRTLTSLCWIVIWTPNTGDMMVSQSERTLISDWSLRLLFFPSEFSG